MIRVTALQAYAAVCARILDVAAEQLSARELEVLHEILINILAGHVEARRARREAA